MKTYIRIILASSILFITAQLIAQTCFKFTQDGQCFHRGRAYYEDYSYFDSNGDLKTCSPPTIEDPQLDSGCQDGKHDMFCGTCGDSLIIWPNGPNSVSTGYEADIEVIINNAQIYMSEGTHINNSSLNDVGWLKITGSVIEGQPGALGPERWSEIKIKGEDAAHGDYIRDTVIRDGGHIRLNGYSSISSSSFNLGRSRDSLYAVEMNDHSSINGLDMTDNDYTYINRHGLNIYVSNSHTAEDAYGLSNINIHETNGYGIVLDNPNTYRAERVPLSNIRVNNTQDYCLVIGGNNYPIFGGYHEYRDCGLFMIGDPDYTGPYSPLGGAANFHGVMGPLISSYDNASNILGGALFNVPGNFNGHLTNEQGKAVPFYLAHNLTISPQSVFSEAGKECTGIGDAGTIYFEGGQDDHERMRIEALGAGITVNNAGKAVLRNLDITSYLEDASKAPGDWGPISLSASTDVLDSTMEYGEYIAIQRNDAARWMCLAGNVANNFSAVSLLVPDDPLVAARAAVIRYSGGALNHLEFKSNSIIHNAKQAFRNIDSRSGPGTIRNIMDNCFLYSGPQNATVDTVAFHSGKDGYNYLSAYAKFRRNIFSGKNNKYLLEYQMGSYALPDWGTDVGVDEGYNYFSMPQLNLNSYLSNTSNLQGLTIKALGNFYYDRDVAEHARLAIDTASFEVEVDDARWVMGNLSIMSILPSSPMAPGTSGITVAGYGMVDMAFQGQKLMQIRLDDDEISDYISWSHESGTHITRISVNIDGYNAPGLHKIELYIDKCGISQSATSFYLVDGGDEGDWIGPGNAYFVSKKEGTTAGGAEVVLISSEIRNGLTFGAGTKVYFDDDNCTEASCSAECMTTDNDDQDELMADSLEVLDPRTLRITTPRFIEESTSIIVDRSGDGIMCDFADDVILANYADGYPAYTFKTLAYTANQGGGGPGSQGVSVVDTRMNGPFVTPSMGLDQAVIPVGMAYDQGDHPGRTLFVVDAGSGDLLVADGSNFAVRQSVVLQSEVGPDGYIPRRGAIDVATDHSGQYAYVAHMTYGGRGPTSPPYPPFIWNPLGSVSVVGRQADGSWALVDMPDGEQGPTTGGAPEGFNRIQPPYDWAFVPLSIEDIYIPKANMGDYVAGDRFPGEYLFLSGVGPARWEWIPDPHCLPGYHCPPIYMLVPRPVVVGIVDLNPEIVSAVTLEKGYTILTKETNPYYQQFVSKVNLRVQEGSPEELYSDQGLGFYPGSTYGQIDVYAVNPSMGTVSKLRFYPDRLPNPVLPPPIDAGDPLETVGIPIPTGPDPSDVKVQTVTIEGQDKTHAYITNAGDDTVTVVDTANNMEIIDSPIYQDFGCVEGDHYPTSIDTRNAPTSTGTHNGYSADFHSGAVSVFDLRTIIMNSPICEIAVGQAPIRIVVQPVPNVTEIFGVVRNSLAFAEPTDFTTPSKQSNLIRDWEAVHQLEQTSANPQAVVSNINVLQGNVDKWVISADLKKSVNEGVNLYRAAYIHDHPTPRP